MELMAAITALEELPSGSNITLNSDSKYVIDGMREWLSNWKKNGWKNASKKPVANKDLWQRLDLAAKGHDIEWCWIKGHNGNPGNERADTLAEEAARQQQGNSTNTKREKRDDQAQ